MVSEQSPHVRVAWSRLREFQDRARAVMDTAIACRADVASLGSTIRIIVAVGQLGMTRLEQDQPPVAEVVEAAVRLRPLFLDREEIHHMKVMHALGLLTRSAAPANREVVAKLKKAWGGFPSTRYWDVATARGTGDLDSAPLRSDRQVAADWLYGDLVHADPERRRRIQHLSEGDRLMAGLLWVKDGILLTRATQQLIIDLETAGELKPR